MQKHIRSIIIAYMANPTNWPCYLHRARVLQRYTATVVYEPLNPTTIFSDLSIGYIAGNKTKNTMCGPPTIGRFTNDQPIPPEDAKEERLIERDLPRSFRTVAIIARRQADSRVAEACWWAQETVSVNHAIFPVPIKRYPSCKEVERGPSDGQRGPVG